MADSASYFMERLALSPPKIILKYRSNSSLILLKDVYQFPKYPLLKKEADLKNLSDQQSLSQVSKPKSFKHFWLSVLIFEYGAYALYLNCPRRRTFGFMQFVCYLPASAFPENIVPGWLSVHSISQYTQHISCRIAHLHGYPRSAIAHPAYAAHARFYNLLSRTLRHACCFGSYTEYACYYCNQCYDT